MAWYQTDTKPLPEPMMTYSELDHEEQISVYQFLYLAYQQISFMYLLNTCQICMLICLFDLEYDINVNYKVFMHTVEIYLFFISPPWVNGFIAWKTGQD